MCLCKTRSDIHLFTNSQDSEYNTIVLKYHDNDTKLRTTANY